jgi:predicted N-acetyltransferase YhbS
MEIAIRPEAPADRQAIRQVHSAAFGGGAEADLVDAFDAA